jgi:hypothetical protein
VLNVFKNKTNYQYRTGSIIREDRSQYYFKYRRITNEDIQKIQYVTGLRTATEEFIISTTYEFPFSILSLAVNIENQRYKILDSYIENNVNTDGIFRQGPRTTYLRIGK